jgi:hypothetical protein
MGRIVNQEIGIVKCDCARLHRRAEYQGQAKSTLTSPWIAAHDVT